MKRDNKIKKLLMMVGVATVAVGMVLPAAGGRSCVHFRPDSKNYLYKTGETAVVEASFTDKAGNALKQGIVELWADDGWTNRVWTRTIDLAKDSQPVRMELSRSTPGSLRIHAKGASIRERMDRILFGVDEIMPLTPCPDGFEEYWRSEQRRLEREVTIDVRKEPASDISNSNSNSKLQLFKPKGTNENEETTHDDWRGGGGCRRECRCCARLRRGRLCAVWNSRPPNAA